MRQANAKDRILQTAGQLFFQRGYSEVGINEIIERAETAKASFYQHFSSKEALCEAWLAAVHDRSEDQRAALLAAASNPTAKLECYFDELAAFMINSQFRGCPYSNTGAVSAATCTGIVAQIQGHKDSLRRFFREICSLQLDESSRAEEIGDRIFLLYSGATTECQNLRTIWPVEVARKAALELLSR
jgi:AcrR family transcriptional regulator